MNGKHDRLEICSSVMFLWLAANCCHYCHCGYGEGCHEGLHLVLFASGAVNAASKAAALVVMAAPSKAFQIIISVARISYID